MAVYAFAYFRDWISVRANPTLALPFAGEGTDRAWRWRGYGFDLDGNGGGAGYFIGSFAILSIR